jgi:hypothetical protein
LFHLDYDFKQSYCYPLQISKYICSIYLKIANYFSISNCIILQTPTIPKSPRIIISKMTCTEIYSNNFKRISVPKKALANSLKLELDLEDEDECISSSTSNTTASSTSTLRSLANATVCTHKSWNSLSMFQLKSTTPSRVSNEKKKSTIKQIKKKNPLSPSLSSSSSSSYVNDWLQRQTQHYQQFIFQKRKEYFSNLQNFPSSSSSSSSSPSSSYLFSFSKSISCSSSSYLTNSTKISSSMSTHSCNKNKKLTQILNECGQENFTCHLSKSIMDNNCPFCKDRDRERKKRIYFLIKCNFLQLN